MSHVPQETLHPYPILTDNTQSEANRNSPNSEEDVADSIMLITKENN